MPRSAPEDGDIVIRQDEREGRVVFILHTAPGADQYLPHSREEAVAQALEFAQREHVRAWFDNGDDRFVLLGTFRGEIAEQGHPPRLVLGAPARRRP